LGRKAKVKMSYQKIVKKLRKLGVKPPEYKSYLFMGEDGRRVIRTLVKMLEENAPPEEGKRLQENSGIIVPNLPSRFYIVGDWVTSLADASGQRILVKGYNMKAVKTQ
jgi:hypothetical protein